MCGCIHVHIIDSFAFDCVTLYVRVLHDVCMHVLCASRSVWAMSALARVFDVLECV